MLIVGGHSFLGRALRSEAARRSMPNQWTSRRPEGGGLPLDLERPNIDSWVGVEGSGRTPAFLCAAETQIDRCALHPNETRRVNVDGTIGLARELVRRGFRIIYFSTDYVFSDRRDLPLETDEPDPETHYGRQKREAEIALLQTLPGTLVLRTSKILSYSLENESPFLKTALGLLKGQPWNALVDQLWTPVFVEDYGRFLLDRELPEGIRHFTSAEVLSAWQIHQDLVSALGITPDLIKEIHVNELPVSEPRKRRCVLGTRYPDLLLPYQRPIGESLRMLSRALGAGRGPG